MNTINRMVCFALCITTLAPGAALASKTSQLRQLILAQTSVAVPVISSSAGTLRVNVPIGMTFDGKDVHFKGAKPVIIENKAYVPVREFCEKLEEHFGIRIRVDWQGGTSRVVELTRMPDRDDSDRALLLRTAFLLSRGDVEGARDLLGTAASAGSPAAKEALRWMRPEKDSSVIVLYAKELPATARLAIDGEVVDQDASLLILPSGQHEVAVRQGSRTVFTQAMMASPGSVYRVAVHVREGS